MAMTTSHRAVGSLLVLALTVACLYMPGASARREVTSGPMRAQPLRNAQGVSACAGAHGIRTMYYAFEVADLDVDVQNGVVTVTPYSSLGGYTAKIGFATTPLSGRYDTDTSRLESECARDISDLLRAAHGPQMLNNVGGPQYAANDLLSAQGIANNAAFIRLVDQCRSLRFRPIATITCEPFGPSPPNTRSTIGNCMDRVFGDYLHRADAANGPLQHQNVLRPVNIPGARVPEFFGFRVPSADLTCPWLTSGHTEFFKFPDPPFGQDRDAGDIARVMIDAFETVNPVANRDLGRPVCGNLSPAHTSAMPVVGQITLGQYYANLLQAFSDSLANALIGLVNNGPIASSFGLTRLQRASPNPPLNPNVYRHRLFTHRDGTDAHANIGAVSADYQLVQYVNIEPSQTPLLPSAAMLNPGVWDLPAAPAPGVGVNAGAGAVNAVAGAGGAANAVNAGAVNAGVGAGGAIGVGAGPNAGGGNQANQQAQGQHGYNLRPRRGFVETSTVAAVDRARQYDGSASVDFINRLLQQQQQQQRHLQRQAPEEGLLTPMFNPARM